MGIFGSDYESAGVGIAKNAPKKKGIFRFFELMFRKFWKLVQVNMLYSAFYLPLVVAFYALFGMGNRNLGLMLAGICVIIFAILVGPATAAMMKILRNYTLEKHAFILTDFKKAFSDNFKKSVALGIIDVLLIISVSSAVYVYSNLADVYGNVMLVFFVISLSIGIMAVMMNFYAFLMIVATDLSFKNIMKNSLALACVALKKNLLTLLIVLLVSAVFVVLTIFNLATLFLLPLAPAAFLGFVVAFNSYPVIQKYVINPYYEQRGEVNPELEEAQTDEDDDEVLFEDKGGQEAPVEKVKKPKAKAAKKTPKGKIIS